MEARKLRIGNFVRWGFVDMKITLYLLNKLSKNKEDFEPIPLTEEWLIKFGARTLIPNTYTLELDNLEIYFCDGKIEIVAEHEIIKLPHIKYVHQLQNLYFALTGEELTIK